MSQALLRWRYASDRDHAVPGTEGTDQPDVGLLRVDFVPRQDPAPNGLAPRCRWIARAARYNPSMTARELAFWAGRLEKESNWADPITYRSLEVWYPGFYRAAQLFKRDGTPRKPHRTQPFREEGNRRARWSIREGLGYDRDIGHPDGWVACHIWGSDRGDGERIVDNPDYYSRLANLLLLPSDLHKEVDDHRELRSILQTCAFYLYEWLCPQPTVSDRAEPIRNGRIPDFYPKNWPSSRGDPRVPRGIVRYNSAIAVALEHRKQAIEQHKDCWELKRCTNPVSHNPCKFC